MPCTYADELVLQFAESEIGLLWRGDPEEELALHAWEVGGDHEKVVALGQLGLQGGGPVVGVGHPSHQDARHGVLQGLANLLVELEEGETDGKEGVPRAKLVPQLPPPLLHQGDAHLGEVVQVLPQSMGERNAHLVGSLLGQLELELWVAEEAGQTRVGGARTTALLVPASLHRRRRRIR